MTAERNRTRTSAFGASKRESHDASPFYERFTAPAVSDDSTVVASPVIDQIIVGDARDMSALADNSVALVVTSPPYFAGKAYETDMSQGHVPGSYLDYLDMLHQVFTECARVLEPGGRIAVNVANLGRKPYRSLSSDVIGILQDQLGLLLRGEVIWQKSRGATGSCAWGSFQRPSNPVLRDLTERIVIASKGRFDRAVPASTRAKREMPSTATITRDEFMEATLDVWEMNPESATRVGHPAPFPVELPGRLIDLFTYEGDIVLDPFMGAGSTAVAAVERGRRYIGFETDSSYAAAAEDRIGQVISGIGDSGNEVQVEPSAPRGEVIDLEHGRLIGCSTRELAAIVLKHAGFSDIITKTRPVKRIDIPLQATAPDGTRWLFDIAGTRTGPPNGLSRNDVLWRTIGRAVGLNQLVPDSPFAVFTVDPPASGGAGATQLAGVVGPDAPVRAVLDLRTDDCLIQLKELLA